MATQPVKHEPPHPPAPAQHAEPRKVVGQPEGETLMPLAEPGAGVVTPTIGVKGEPIEDGERDPDTIAEEQRRRSAEYEAGLGKADTEAKHALPHAPPPHTNAKK